MFRSGYAFGGRAAAGSLGGVATSAGLTGPTEENYPGEQLGLAPAGRGSLASWMSRIAAIVLDWAASMAIAIGFFGSGVLTGGGWRSWMILAVFFVQASLLSAVAGGSFGQLICRIGIYRLDAEPLGVLRALLRTAMLSLALPALIVGAHRRGLHDLAAGTVVINRR